MEASQNSPVTEPSAIREMLLGSRYSDRAIAYYLEQASMGSLAAADQITEMTGPCGDTMKVYLKLSGDTVTDVKYQVLGCPGAIAAAMAAAEMVRGKGLAKILDLKDRDVFRKLESIPEQKQHCIRLAVKTLQKAVLDCLNRKDEKRQGE